MQCQRPPARRRSLAACALALATFGCGRGELQPVWDERPPNVLLITIDTLRADHLGLYGYERDTSPHLDALAERSAVFEEAHSSSSWTLPGLASMLTAEHSSTHGCWSFASVLGPQHRTLSERLLAHGYDTASVTASIFIDQGYGLQQGIVLRRDELVNSESFDFEDSITSPGISDHAVRYLEQKAAARAADADPWPWFLWLHYVDPHDAYVFHAGFSEPFLTEGADELQRIRDLYDGEIRFTDHHVGRVLEALERTGLDEDTLIVVTSDHGEEFGDHGARHHGHTLFRELTRIPLLVAGPGVQEQRTDELVQIVDVSPTVLELVGAPPIDGAPGRSLAPLLRGDTLEASGALQELRARRTASFESYRSGRWTLIRPLAVDSVPELYDHRADPAEQRNVAGDYPDVVERLVAELEATVRTASRRADRFGGIDLRDLSSEELATLEALGYTGSDDADAGGTEPDGERRDTRPPGTGDEEEMKRPLAMLLLALSAALTACGEATFRETRFADGSPWTRIGLRDGELHGPFQTWYEGGAPRSEGGYASGLPVGWWRTWHANGQLASEGRFVEGRPDGRWLAFAEDGSPKTEDNFANGRRDGRRVVFDQDGSPLAVEFHRDGRREGVRVIFRDSGVPELEEPFEADSRHGLVRSWDEAGNLVEVTRYREGRPLGLQVFYRPDGTKLAQGEHGTDGRTGPWFVWEPDGSLGPLSGRYAAGERIGPLSAEQAADGGAAFERIDPTHFAPPRVPADL